MAQHPIVPFALPYEQLPGGFEYPPYATSEVSASEVFNADIDNRDGRVCVVCGADLVHHAHIIPKVEESVWEDLRTRGWIPYAAKSVAHEARNGLLLCPNHHAYFDNLAYYIRWNPELHKFIFINHSRRPALEMYHGKGISLDPDNNRSPFRSILLIHEARVRGRHPFMGDRSLPAPVNDQDWIHAPAIASSSSNQSPPGQLGDGGPSHLPAPQAGDSSTQQGGSQLRYSVGQVEGPGWIMFTNPFADLSKLDGLVDSFRDAPNWKASVIEGGGWDGTAEENTAKYLSSVKVDEGTNEEEGEV